MSTELENATLGGGCFWCLDGIFSNVKGIEKVISGYSGGNVENPSYEAVCTGLTGHAEVVQLTFNPEKITYQEILEIFFFIHDSTTFNRQGNDIGTQYRSVIFYHSEEQKNLAQKIIEELEDKKVFNDSIKTDIVEYSTFYEAEDYHQGYYQKNSNQPYCKMVISPKVKKFKLEYYNKMK